MLRFIKAFFLSFTRFLMVMFGIGALVAAGVIFYSGYYLPKQQLGLHAVASTARYFDPSDVEDVDVNEPVFRDVPVDHPHASALASLKKQGIIKGFDDDSFKPDEKLERGAFMKLVVTSRNAYPHQVRYSHCFTDVGSEWFAPYVCYGKSKGWVSGDGQFYPLDPTTRSQGLKVLMGVFNVEPGVEYESSFSDVGEDSWYAPYVVVGEQRGWFNGLYEGEFKPDESMSRGEVAELLFRMMATERPR